MSNRESYRPRPIRFIEYWTIGAWRLKAYGISSGEDGPRPELLAAAKAVAEDRLQRVADGHRHYGVGFVGIHEGKTADFVFVDWWADDNELHHHLYVSPRGRPLKLQYVTPTGLTACVWDLYLMGFERDAWVETVLNNPVGSDLEAYLRRRLNARNLSGVYPTALTVQGIPISIPPWSFGITPPGGKPSGRRRSGSRSWSSSRRQSSAASSGRGSASPSPTWRSASA